MGTWDGHRVRRYTGLMVVQAFDPRHLDVAAFAAAQGQLSGEWLLASLHRLGTATSGPADASVVWTIRGERREQPPGTAEIWLHLRADITLELVCQRCLQGMPQALNVARSFRFVKDEAEAERLDELSEDDVLALGHPLDLLALVEDELILALPLIPRHEVCPHPLMAQAGAPQGSPSREDNAFAVLATLRQRPDDEGHDA
jgi:uncharacterized protein